MPDVVSPANRPPVTAQGHPLSQRWKEVRPGEWAPEVAPVTAGSAPVRDGSEVSVAGSTWTTLATRTVPAGAAEELEFLQADIAALLDTRYRVRLQIAGVTIFEEQLTTGVVGAFYPKGLRAEAGEVANWQIFHAEVANQVCRGILTSRPV